MPRPATTSARRYDSNSNNSAPPPPPSYKSHDTSVSPTDPTINSQPSTNLNLNLNDTTTTVHASLLQPRVAVALGLSAKWHPLLFVCRLMSILPALWWGIPVALRLLAQLVVLVGSSSAARAYADKTQSIPWLRGYGRIDAPDISGSGSHDTLGSSIDFETRLMITEMALGIVWCASSAYLSFTFTDCLMSRWLLLYTPQATLVRLLATNTTNLYLTSRALHLAGVFSHHDVDSYPDNPHLFLPAWIAIASALTALYHLTQRKINIRKETRLSISVFSAASFVSMVGLLAAVQAGRPAAPGEREGGGGGVPPVVEMGRALVQGVERVRGRVREWGGGGGGERDGL